MFDYARLDDLDFEKLCGDMMGRVLDSELRYFPSGRAGGIDLVDDLIEKNILIQVKHYEKSSFSTFKSAMKKEIEKVENLQPKQYYIFTSQSLTASNIKEIYSMFQEYMDSEKNIVTRENIDQFLKKEENIDILRSQFKLWITADVVLKDFFNQDIFLDSEVLLSDIDEEIKYFIQTEVFNECIKTLEVERKILLYGDPGVGKTLNSKMLLLHFVKNGYRVRYSSNAEITELKKSVTSNKDLKEIIFLDDCLGQHYFKLRAGHGQELLSLIKHVNLYENKVLILNSRVTILNEARNTFEELDRYFSMEKISIRKINMNEISLIEKAKIFYTLLKKNKVSDEYYKSVRNKKNYLRVIQHKNYNPRIIEYVTLPHKLKDISSNKYYDFVMDNLIDPQNIWKNEFEQRIQSIDRIFMYTLYSLTDTYVSKDILEECFDYLISQDSKIDTTVYNFESTLMRLNQSTVKTLDYFGQERIGVLNPSVNDYMHTTIYGNKLLLNKLRQNAIYLNQLERLHTHQELKEILKQLVINDQLFEYKTIKEGQLFEVGLHTIGENIILNERYMQDMNLLVHLKPYSQLGKYSIKKVDLLKRFLQNHQLREFYEIENVLLNFENIKRIIEDLSFEDAVFLTDAIVEFLSESQRDPEGYISNHLMGYLLDELEYYLDEFEYGYSVENWIDPAEQIELQETDYISIIKEVQEEIDKLLSSVNNTIIKSNIKDRFKSYEDDIKSNIDDVVNDIYKEKNNPRKEFLPKSNVEIDDILNRSI